MSTQGSKFGPDFIQLKFRNPATEQEFRRICHLHGICFRYIEECINRDYRLVESGSGLLYKVDIGVDRILENPSRRLESLVHAYISGTSYARGKPLKQDQHEILEGIVLE